MDLAISLGFPHYELMLDQMSASQYKDLILFLNIKTKQKAEAAVEAEDNNIRNFIGRVAAKQKAGNTRG